MKKIIILSLLTIVASTSSYAKRITVVAAENQYGSVAKLIGGNNVSVTNIINNADGDPHTFISSVKNAKLLADADIIIYNGADYDSWINSILKSNKNAVIIKVQDLDSFKKTSKLGINPHLWFKPQTFPALAKKLTSVYTKLDSDDANLYKNNYKEFKHKYQTVYNMVDDIKTKYKDTPVTATEPLFSYMAEALELQMQGLKFQWVIMNESEPSPRMMIDYQDLLKDKKVKVLFYNQQVVDTTTKNILNLAKKNDIPVVGVTETMPANKDAILWMIDTLGETQKALEQLKEKSTTPTKND
ncbi:MAG: zinc/manganese transport system substrate-binding protein [Francisella sp.]|jgi:zinc/manganese transport system substrate-binding protein